MKYFNKNKLFMLLLLFAGTASSLLAQGEYTLPKSDGHKGTQTVNEQLMFYDNGGKTGAIDDYYNTAVCFAPQSEGEQIEITFNSFDITGFATVYIYDGEIAFPSYSSPIPENHIAALNEQYSGNMVFQSTTGKLSVLYYSYQSGQSSSGSGWEATVTNLPAKDMEFVSAGVFLDNEAVNRGGRSQILLGANVKMDGGGNPHTLNELVFNTAELSSAKVENVRLYSSSEFTEANLLANSPAVGATIGCNSDITLRHGDNRFYLVADVKPNASGTIPSATLTSVKINGEAKAISPATAANPVTIANTILIATEHLTYTIDGSAGFYDDGGIAGKISSNFTGAVTFVPANPGQQIRIDFSKLEIFNTSSTGMNDVFKFYNGQTVDEDNLITTLLKDAEIVKSTAADGSLTVTLKSTTGVPANGWEAVASEFVPDNMTLDAITATQALNTTLAAGSADEQFVLLNVKTTNTLIPLEVQEILVDASQTSRLSSLANAKVYFLGKNATFNTNTLFGQVTDIDNASISITGAQALIEGNNWFALTYSLANDALNNEVVAAKLTGVKLSGAVETLAEPVAVQRTVENIFRAKGGTHTVTLYDNWTYTDTKSTISGYTDYYEFVNEDRIVTFVPAAAGAVAEIDFSSFDVYYYNANGYTKAVFEIYSGQTVDANNLLWKLDDESKKKTGPGKLLRSTAADGAITIKFNANTSYSWDAAKGWVATVRPFINHNMTVEEVTAFQDNTSNLRPGSANQEIIGFKVTTEGTLTSLTLSEVKLNLKTSLPAIEKVSVLYSAGEKDFSQAVAFGSTTALTQEVTITGSQVLPEGVSYFWVAYDIKGDAAVDSEVDAALVSVKTGEDTHTPVTGGDPEGNRVVKNEVLLTNGDNGQFTLSQPVKFYDEGGPSGSFNQVSTFPFDGKITFLPSPGEDAVKIEFNDIDLSYTEYIYIYAGTEVDEGKLLATVSGVSSPTSPFFPKPIISPSPDGALTFRFKVESKSNYFNNRGWEADVYSYTKVPFYVSSITTAQVGGDDIMRGSENAAVQQIKVVVKGDLDEVSLNSFGFTNGVTTSAGDITQASLYYTGASAGMVLNSQVGASATASPYTFTAGEDIKIAKEGAYYFWLAYDIKAGATPGNIIGAALTGIEVNGEANSGITEESAVSRTIKSGMAGTYIVGASDTANYASITAAVNALKDGVEGPVVFKMEAGTYSENVLVQAIPGTSASSTITFTSLSGSNNDVKITGTGTNTNTVKYVFKVEQTPYIVLENISLIPASQSYEYVLHLTQQSRYFTLRNCILEADVITATGYISGALRHVFVEGLDVEGQNCDYFTAEGNTLTGGDIGFYLYGTTNIGLTKQNGAVIRNNTLISQRAKSIYFTGERDALIEGNTISFTSGYSGAYGIDAYCPTGRLVIRNNRMNLTSTHTGYGIQLRSNIEGIKGEEQHPMLIYNNSIGINSASASTYGICMDATNGDQYVNFYHNSVNISGTSGRCFGVTGSATDISNMVFQNNLLQNNTESGSVYFFGKTEQYEAFTFSNNAYWCTGDFTNTHVAFADWTSASDDLNSMVEKADFFSDTDLHLKSEGSLNAGLPVSFVTADIEGTVRSTTAPTIGAYEYETVVIVTPEIAEGYPKTGSITNNSIEFKTKWTQSGNLYGIIKKATEEAPSKPELLATAAVNLSSEVENTSKFTGLDEETEYKAYFIFVSTLDVESDIVESDVATTVKEILPLTVTLPAEWDWVDAGTAVEIYPLVTGGIYPYTYLWQNAENVTLSTDSILNVAPAVVSRYTLTVTDNNGATANLYTDVYINSMAQVAGFDDLHLAPESYRYSHVYDNSEAITGSWGNDEYNSVFYSGSYSFTNTYTPDYDSWTGFAYSNVTATAFDPNEFLTHQFRSVTGMGAGDSENYAVIFVSGTTEISVMHNMSEGDNIAGVFLTNSAYTMHSVINGDDYVGEPFAQGDYYKVIFTGKDTDNTTTSSVEYYLIDYRSANSSEHFALDEWKWFDLSALGKVAKVAVSVDASRKSQWGITLPTYLCMDNLGAAEPIDSENPTTPTNLTAVAGETAIDLSWTASTDNVAVTGYNVYVDGQPVETVTGTSCIITGLTPQTAYRIEVEAFDADGNKSAKASITVTTGSTGIGETLMEAEFTVYPNPFTDYIIIEIVSGGTATIYNLSGTVVLSVNLTNGSNRIETSALPQGLYLLKIGENAVKIVK